MPRSTRARARVNPPQEPPVHLTLSPYCGRPDCPRLEARTSTCEACEAALVGPPVNDPGCTLALESLRRCGEETLHSETVMVDGSYVRTNWCLTHWGDHKAIR